MPAPYKQVLDAAETLEDYPLSPSDMADLGRAGLQAAADQLAFMIVTPDAVHRDLQTDVLTEVNNPSSPQVPPVTVTPGVSPHPDTEGGAVTPAESLERLARHLWVPKTYATGRYS
jgi:hypothetical protein